MAKTNDEQLEEITHENLDIVRRIAQNKFDQLRELDKSIKNCSSKIEKEKLEKKEKEIADSIERLADHVEQLNRELEGIKKRKR